MAKSRIEIVIAVIVLGIGLAFTAVLGSLWYMRTSAPLHETAQDVPSTPSAEPATKFAGAVTQARQAVSAELYEQNLPGAAVAVGIGDQLVWSEGFGWADLEKRTPVEASTRFRIGTASVALTSAAIGLLVEQGRLKLDDEIQAYVPEFPKKPWPVTVRQLMGHMAGVANDGGDEGPLFSQNCERPVDALPAFAQQDLRFQPGTQYRYSSYGWILLSAAVEAAAKEPFLRMMRTQVFEPLGMQDTQAESATESIQNRAAFYFPRFAADPRYGLHVMRDLDYSCYAGASVFLSTAPDLVRFGMAINRGALLRPATVQMLQASQKLPSGEETGYGLGWDLEQVTLAGKSARVAGHDGDALGGMVVSLLTFPDRGIVVAVLSNLSYADTFGIGVKVAAAFDAAGSR